MLGGRSADLLGRRRVFLAGTALFALSSLAVRARRLARAADRRPRAAGASAARSSRRPRCRSSPPRCPRAPSATAASALWGAVGGLGASSGALLGGVLTQALGWPAIFAVNVPLGRDRDRARPAGDPRRRSRASARATSTLTGAVLVTGGPRRARPTGSSAPTRSAGASPGVLVPLAAGGRAARRVRVRRGAGREAPLVPLSIFRLRPLRAANMVVVLLYAALFPAVLLLTLYLQQVLQLRRDRGRPRVPADDAVDLRRLVARAAARRAVRRAPAVIAAGMLFAAAGLLLLSGVRPGGSYSASVLPGGVLSALGMGLASCPSTIVGDAGRAAPAERAGLRAAQHLAAGRRRARARRAEHDRRVEPGSDVGVSGAAGADQRVRRVRASRSAPRSRSPPRRSRPSMRRLGPRLARRGRRIEESEALAA